MQLAVIKKDGKYLNHGSWISDIERAQTFWMHSHEIEYNIMLFGGYKKAISIVESMENKACPVCDKRVDTDEDLLQDRPFFKGRHELICPHCLTQLVAIEWQRSNYVSNEYYYEICVDTRFTV
jgi:uncharacterized CHY-type Zn-finger protein